MKQKWEVMTYGEGAVVSDPYYRENMVIGDLPAGRYLVWIPYESFIQSYEVEVRAGMVTYFEFNGKDGFSDDQPPTPAPDFTPPISTTVNLPQSPRNFYLNWALTNRTLVLNFIPLLLTAARLNCVCWSFL
jgi:hypothetical protein